MTLGFKRFSCCRVFRLAVCVLASLVVAVIVSPAIADDEAKSSEGKMPEKVTYDEHIQPIFRENCFACHNQDDPDSDLALDSYARVMQGGAGGVAIAPGDPDGSRLWKLVSHQESPEMPLEDDKLPDESLALIKAWIAGGVLENTGSKPRVAKKPAFDVTTGAGSGRPEGAAVMPQGLSRQPAVYTSRGMAVTTIAASPWAPLVAIAGHHQILLYHTDSGELLGVLPYPEGIAHVLKFSRNGALLLAAGGHAGKSGSVVIFDVKSGKRAIDVGDELDAVLAADLTEDHTLVALGGPQKVVRIYSTSDATEPLHVIRKHTEWIYAIEFSPDGVLLATADRNGGLLVWETETAREYLDLRGHGGAVTDVSWRLDSNVLASASEDGTIRLWEMQNGGQIKSWGAHGGGTLSVRFTHDGRLISAGRDRTVKVWDQEGKQLQAFEAFADLALEATFTHDGARAVGGDWSGEIRMWEVADGKRVAMLPMNPPTLEMTATATAHAAARAQGELAKAEAALDAAAKTTEGLTATAAEAAKQVTASQEAIAKTTAEFEVIKKAVADKTAAAKTAADALAAAQAALEKAQGDLSAAQKEGESKAAALKTAGDEAVARKAAADKLAAEKAAAEQALAEKKAALDAATQKVAAAIQAAGKAAAEKAAYDEAQTAQAKTSQ